MAQPYVTGPAHIFVRADDQLPPQYFGTTERTPKILIRPSWEPVFNDVGGKVPFDVAYEGEEAFISGDFNRFNEQVYTAMAARASFTSPRGHDVGTTIGTLMLTEGAAYELWVSFPYSAKPVFDTMPDGYHFFNCYLVGPDELEPLGTTPRKERLIWHALRGFNLGFGGSMGNISGTFIDPSPNFNLYDHDMSGIAGIIID